MSGIGSRKKAWVVTAVIMVLAVFLGAWGSFGAKRRDVVEAFEAEILPHIERALIPAFNVQTVAANYLSQPQIFAFDIGRIVRDIQEAEDPLDVYKYYVKLNQAIWDVAELLESMGMSETNRGLINNFHRNFNEIDLILSQSGYNNAAGEFNAARGGNLGFLVRFVVDEMPRFDVFEY